MTEKKTRMETARTDSIDGPRVETTIGLPVTASDADQIMLRMLDAIKTGRGLRNRTELIRLLIVEEAARVEAREKKAARS